MGETLENNFDTIKDQLNLNDTSFYDKNDIKGFTFFFTIFFLNILYLLFNFITFKKRRNFLLSAMGMLIIVTIVFVLLFFYSNFNLILVIFYSFALFITYFLSMIFAFSKHFKTENIDNTFYGNMCHLKNNMLQNVIYTTPPPSYNDIAIQKSHVPLHNNEITMEFNNI